MIGSMIIRPSTAALVAGLALGAHAGTSPAAAQTAPAEGAGMSSADCAPGALGESGTYEASSTEDGAIVRAEVAYQCERTLDDGTYVPEGYRVQLWRACEEGTCELPFLFATEGRDDIYTARLEDGDTPTTIRLRANQGGALVVRTVSGAGQGSERDRDRYVLRPSG